MRFDCLTQEINSLRDELRTHCRYFVSGTRSYWGTYPLASRVSRKWLAVKKET